MVADAASMLQVRNIRRECPEQAVTRSAKEKLNETPPRENPKGKPTAHSPWEGKTTGYTPPKGKIKQGEIKRTSSPKERTKERLTTPRLPLGSTVEEVKREGDEIVKEPGWVLPKKLSKLLLSCEAYRNRIKQLMRALIVSIIGNKWWNSLKRTIKSEFVISRK